MIKDSGNRTEFDTGAVRDMHEDKGRCDLMPLDVVADLYCRWFPKKTTGSVFRELYNFTKTGYVGHLFNALAEDDIYEATSDMLLETAKHFEQGAKKYGEHNWQKGIPTKSYIDSAVRHYLKYLRGDDDERHDRAFVWNILCCIWTCKHKPELNDYRKEDSNADD